MQKQTPLITLKRLASEDSSDNPYVKLLVYESNVVFVTPPQSGHLSEKTVIWYKDIKEVKDDYDSTDRMSLEIITNDNQSYHIPSAKKALVEAAHIIITHKIKQYKWQKKLQRPVKYDFHYMAIQVKDIAASEEFYKLLGFKKVFAWTGDDKSSRARLRNKHFWLELICPSSKHSNSYPTNNGVQQLALRVLSLEKAKEDLTKKGIPFTVPTIKGKPKVNNLLIQDPDGTHIEIFDNSLQLISSKNLFEEIERPLI